MATVEKLTIDKLSTFLELKAPHLMLERAKITSGIFSRFKWKKAPSLKTIPLKVNIGEYFGVGARPLEAGGLPSSDIESLVSGSYDLKRIVVSRKFTPAYFKQIQTEGIPKEDVKVLMNNLADVYNRYLFNAGGFSKGYITNQDSGLRASVTPTSDISVTTSSSVEITLDWDMAGSTYAPGRTRIFVGQRYDVYDRDGSQVGTMICTDINPSDKRKASFKAIDSNFTIASANGAHDLYVEGAKGYDITSLSYIIHDSGSLFGIDRSTYAWWKGLVSDINNANSLNVTTLRKIPVLYEVAGRLHQMPRDLFTTNAQLKALRDSLESVSAVRIVLETKQYEFGNKTYAGLDIDDFRVMSAYEVPPGHLFGINFDSVYVSYVERLDWLTVGGSKFIPVVSDTEVVYYLIGEAYLELFSDDPQSNVKIYGLSESYSV